jgi:tetratricopeptide (TPR) repeat protein
MSGQKSLFISCLFLFVTLRAGDAINQAPPAPRQPARAHSLRAVSDQEGSPSLRAKRSNPHWASAEPYDKRWLRFAKKNAPIYKVYDLHAKHFPYPELVEGRWLGTAADAGNRGLSPNPSFDKLRMRSVENRSMTPSRAPAPIPLDRAVALYGEAQTLFAAGDAQGAADKLDEALRLRPHFAEALAFGGYLIERSGRTETAARFYGRALELKPDMAIVWSNYGKVLFRLRQFDAALAAFDAALALKRDADGLNGRAATLRELGQLDASAAAASEALSRDPLSAEAALNLGNALHKLGRPDEALAAYRAALAQRPDYADALCGSALALRALGQLDESRAAFAQAEALGCREAISGRGCLDLMLGDFERGFEGYEARWIAGRSLAEALGLRFPWWSGPGSSARRVLVFNDHGLGDTIQFVRYLPLMRAAGVEATLIVPRKLHRLLAPSLETRLVEASPEGEAFDAQIALSSLPRAFGTRLSSVPANVPYLAAERERIAPWRARLSGPGLAIGVVWQGNPDPAADRARSFPLAALAPVAAVAGVRLVALQIGEGLNQLNAARFPILTPGDGFDAGADAFVDAAAAMMSLDLIICCDTSVAHLAGALGRPVWIALKFDAEWRWMRERDDSPWYPTARLFRQPAAGDWGTVFTTMARTLPGLAQSRTP